MGFCIACRRRAYGGGGGGGDGRDVLTLRLPFMCVSKDSEESRLTYTVYTVRYVSSSYSLGKTKKEKMIQIQLQNN